MTARFVFSNISAIFQEDVGDVQAQGEQKEHLFDLAAFPPTPPSGLPLVSPPPFQPSPALLPAPHSRGSAAHSRCFLRFHSPWLHMHLLHLEIQGAHETSSPPPSFQGWGRGLESRGVGLRQLRDSHPSFIPQEAGRGLHCNLQGPGQAEEDVRQGLSNNRVHERHQRAA